MEFLGQSGVFLHTAHTHTMLLMCHIGPLTTISFCTWALNLALACCLACQYLACLCVYHPFCGAACQRTSSHGEPRLLSMCFILQSLHPSHHALSTLHKMCISRAALSPAHAERTCSVALLNTYHGRISASNSPQLHIPANENAQKREGERGRERTPRDTKSEPNPTQTDTTQVEGKAVTFPTHLQT